MKSLLIFCLSIFTSFSVYSQHVIQAGNNLELENNFKEQLQKRKRSVNTVGHNKAATCDIDTLKFSQYKGSTTRFISLNTTSSARGYGQFFPVKDSVIIYGFNVYAYAQTFSGSEAATANLYFANSTDKVPTGTPIISEPVNIFYNYWVPLENIKTTVLFATPYVARFNFVLTLESNTTGGINVATSNWDLDDGQQEGMSSVKFAAGWTNGLNVTVGSTTPPTDFDCDVYIEPIVQYKLKSKFEISDESCLTLGIPVDFVNKSTPITDAAYNPFIVDKMNDDPFVWEYGDSSPPDTAEHGNHTYVTAGVTKYNVKLNSTFSGWTMPNTCTDEFVGLIQKPNIDAKFSASVSQGTVTCNNTSVESVSWFWQFGDGTTDTVKSPVHTYSAAGLYAIKLIARNGGCVDSALSTVNIESTGINELTDKGFKLYPNPVTERLTIDFTAYPEAIVSNSLSVELYTLSGSKVNAYSVNRESGKLILDLKALSKGNYLVRISKSDGALIGKSVIVKE